MTTRRTVLKAMSLGPAVLASNVLPALAAPDPSRISLVIGNSAYRQAPLANPANDASAMRDLLTSAGFSVEAHLDAKRADLLAAVDRFAAAAQQSPTRLAVFYYAGHGVQLDWRNYLLPVDIEVNGAEDVKRQCIDLGRLLGRLAQIRDKNFVIVLDACRDDPFKGAYRPEQKGLSQFDAPVGSLIAYATSPGNVASDGGGRNGLYTENLVRELSIRDAKLEEALKRVRLNVRLSSRGQQVPWESTSLESDVFVFADGARKLSAAELEQLLLDDLAAWGRIKNSRNIDDWVQYLREFPNGRFAEIAQVRLTRMLAEIAKPAPVASPSAPAAGARAEKPVLELKPGGDMTILPPASANPNSAGRYPLGRKFTVGDSLEYRISDLYTGVEQGKTTLRVSRVDEANDRFEANNGEWVFDLMGNVLRAPERGESDIPQQLIPAELQLGRKWTAGWIVQHPKWGKLIFDFECQIEALEDIVVPAGRFKAFRVRALGWIRNGGDRLDWTRWIVPGLNGSIRLDVLSRNRSGHMTATVRWELVSLVQHAFEQGCSVQAVGRTRTLQISKDCPS